jgi:hypothetical protein
MLVLPNALQRAVFDERFAECRAFRGRTAQRRRPVTSAIRGDVAKLWYDDLRVHLRENRLPVAGLTDRAALFCLEELARDVGMRVIFRADHMIDQNGHTQHTAVGPASLVAVARNLPQEAGFGRAVAVLFSQFDISGLNLGRYVRAKTHRAIFSGKQNGAGFVVDRLKGKYSNGFTSECKRSGLQCGPG